MDDKIWITTLAALALGISITVLILYSKNKENPQDGVTYQYDDQNRLQSVVPMRKITLKPV